MWDVKPGDLVVYVGPEILRQTYPWRGPIVPSPFHRGSIYTVRAVHTFDSVYLGIEGQPELDLFWIKRFRPVAKPSIENLRQLTTKPDLVKENA